MGGEVTRREELAELYRKMVELGERADKAVEQLLRLERLYEQALDDARRVSGQGMSGLKAVSAGEFAATCASSLRELSPNWARLVNREDGAELLGVKIALRNEKLTKWGR